MGERIIYSTLCALDENAGAAQIQPLVDMATLWVKHLRGPGHFVGRIILLTNLPDLRLDGVEPVVAPVGARDRRQLFLERVRLYRHVPVRPNDRVMQLDLDALAVAPVERVFAAIRPGVMMAAPSGFSPLVRDHAENLLTRRERWYRRLWGWSYRAGVSASVTACDGDVWPNVMRRWAAAIRGRGCGRPVPPLGDQSFLNFLFVTGAAPIRRFPGDLIYHARRPGVPLDDPEAARATIVHFPLPQKLEEMRRWNRI